MEFVSTLKGLFGGGDGEEKRLLAEQAEKQAEQQDQQQINLQRQQQQQQAEAARVDEQAGRGTRIPRGRRLLLAATGETGLSNKLG
jgi:hypothetical protein